MKQNKRKISGVFAAVCIAACLLGCRKMDYLYQDFIKDGEITYIGKVDSVKFYPGRMRIKVSWKLSPDPDAKFVMLQWIREGVADSAQVPIVRKPGIDTAEYLVEQVQEGPYTFNIRTLDDKGNRSINVERYGTVYGSSYQEQLVERKINTQTKNANELIIKFFSESSEQMVKTELNYEDNDGIDKTVILPAKSTEAKLPGFKYGADLKYRTAFLPDSLAIDTFYTSYTTLRITR